MSYLDIAKKACIRVQGLNIQSTNIGTGEIEDTKLDEMGSFLNMQYGTELLQAMEKFGDSSCISNVVVPAKLGLKFSWGNCESKAALAFLYLMSKDIRPLEMMSVGEDHVVVLIGRDMKSKIPDPSTWGKDAVVCDPWANDAYPASLLKEKAGQAPLASVVGAELIIIQTYELTGDPEDNLVKAIAANETLFKRIIK